MFTRNLLVFLICVTTHFSALAEDVPNTFTQGTAANAEEVKSFLGLPSLGVVSTIVVEADLIRRRQRVRRVAVQLVAVAVCAVVGTAISLVFSLLM